MGYRLDETTLQKMRKPWVLKCTCGFVKLFAMDREDTLREYRLSDHNLCSRDDHKMYDVSLTDYLDETGRL